MTPHPDLSSSIPDLSLAMRQGSGFMVFDHMDGRANYEDVLATARRSGREKDVLVLDAAGIVPAGGSATFNPFAYGSTDVLRALLVTQLSPSPSLKTGDHFFFQRALELVDLLAPVLAWLRDTNSVSLDAAAILHMTELQNLAALSYEGVFRQRDSHTGAVREIRVADPTGTNGILLSPLRSYLSQVGVYDATGVDVRQALREQYYYALMYFTPSLSQLVTRFGHILSGATPGIRMSDVLSRACILAVRVPSLEMSRQSSAPLIRLILGSLKLAIAERLGDALETTSLYPQKELHSTSRGPTFHVVLSDPDAYEAADFDKLAAMGRSAGVRFYSGTSHQARPRKDVGPHPQHGPVPSHRTIGPVRFPEASP